MQFFSSRLQLLHGRPFRETSHRTFLIRQLRQARGDLLFALRNVLGVSGLVKIRDVLNDESMTAQGSALTILVCD